MPLTQPPSTLARAGAAAGATGGSDEPEVSQLPEPSARAQQHLGAHNQRPPAASAGVAEWRKWSGRQLVLVVRTGSPRTDALAGSWLSTNGLGSSRTSAQHSCSPGPTVPCVRVPCSPRSTFPRRLARPSRRRRCGWAFAGGSRPPRSCGASCGTGTRPGGSTSASGTTSSRPRRRTPPARAASTSTGTSTPSTTSTSSGSSRRTRRARCRGCPTRDAARGGTCPPRGSPPGTPAPTVRRSQPLTPVRALDRSHGSAACGRPRGAAPLLRGARAAQPPLLTLRVEGPGAAEDGRLPAAPRHRPALRAPAQALRRPRGRAAHVALALRAVRARRRAQVAPRA
jgi:hypothetical protein